MVVAETRAQALDAAEAVAVEYEPLPWVAQSAGALAPGAPAVWDEVPDNVLVDTGSATRRRPIAPSPPPTTSSRWNSTSAA